jgi:hypothetical protein
MSIKNLYPTVQPSLNLDFANTKQLDPRITFTRTTTARYYDGKTVAKAEENLLTRSQELSTSPWTPLNATTTANDTTAPDGTSTAEKLLETVDNAEHLIYNFSGVSLAAGATTVSFYVKGGLGRDWCVVNVYNGNNLTDAAANVYFDVTNGVVGTVGAGATASIQNAGNGWYRCIVTRTLAAATSGTASAAYAIVGAASADGTSSYAGDITKGIYIWGAQLEQRSTVTAYTPTTDQPITNYIPALQTAAAGQARFDHNPVTGESLGLLIEEQRTNVLLRSEEFNDAAWTKTNATATANTAIAPDGTLTADKVIPANGTTVSRISQSGGSHASGVTLTISLYAKKAEKDTIGIWFNNANISPGGFYGSGFYADLSNGTTNDPALKIINVGNGWYRLSITATTTAAISFSSFIAITAGSTGNVNSVVGDGYSGIYIWGAQLEAGAFPTSYIPTVGSSVTRNADAASMTGVNFSSWYRADEGTLYAEYQRPTPPVASATTVAYFSDGAAAANRMGLQSRNTGPVGENIEVGASRFAFGSLGASDVPIKSAIALAVNDFAGSVNGGSVVTNSSLTFSFAANRLVIGGQWDGLVSNQQHIKKLAYYPARLTNAELAAITTI